MISSPVQTNKEQELFDQLQIKAMKLAKGKSFLVAEELTIESLKQLIPRPEQQETLDASSCNSDINFYASMASVSKFKILVTFEGKPVFAGGLIPMWGEVAEGWLLVDQDIDKLFPRCGLMLVKCVREYFKNVPYVRIQTVVRDKFEVGHRFIKLFGFEEEGKMRKFGIDGYDYYRYARINEQENK